MAASVIAAASILIHDFLHEEDDDDDIDFAVYALTSKIFSRIRKCELSKDNLPYNKHISLREDRIKSQCYAEWTVSNYLPDEFRRFFKVNNETFERLCLMLSNVEGLSVPINTAGRPAVQLEKKVLMTLRYLSSSETIHSLSDRFNVTDSTLLRAKSQCVQGINTFFMPNFVKWPEIEKMDTIASEASSNGTYRFPGVIGAVDGCHISIEAPHENPNSYFNRKRFHSVILQGVATLDLTFIHLNIGWPGRVHDSKVLKNSTLWESGFAKCGNGRYHILGDAAYPLKQWLLPYRDNGHLTQQQKHFNTALASKRQIIERSFGLLKGRFRRLKHVNAKSVQTVCETINAACILHNVCIMGGDVEEEDTIGVVDVCDPAPAQAQVEIDASGVLKRVNITNSIH